MFIMRFISIIIGLFAACEATLSSNCFIKGSGPIGSNNGESFSDIDILTSNKMTANMRVKLVTVCHGGSGIITQGLQMVLQDNVTYKVLPLTRVGIFPSNNMI